MSDVGCDYLECQGLGSPCVCDWKWVSVSRGGSGSGAGVDWCARVLHMSRCESYVTDRQDVPTYI